MLVSLCFDSVILCLIFQVAFEGISSGVRSGCMACWLLVLGPGPVRVVHGWTSFTSLLLLVCGVNSLPGLHDGWAWDACWRGLGGWELLVLLDDTLCAGRWLYGELTRAGVGGRWQWGVLWLSFIYRSSIGLAMVWQAEWCALWRLRSWSTEDTISALVWEPFPLEAVRGPFGSRACGFRRFVFGEGDFGNAVR